MSTSSVLVTVLTGALAVAEPEMVSLGGGVYAVIRTEPLGLVVHSNSLVVVGESGVLVVDAQFTRSATLQTIRALRRVTSLPVRYVVTTHWHEDHVAGNQVYRDSFPDAQFLMHHTTREDLEGAGRAYRLATLRGAPALLDRVTRLTMHGLGIDSVPATDTEILGLRTSVDIMRAYLGEASGFQEVLPTTTVGDRHTIRLHPHHIELRWFGRGNTRGDLIVHLPARRVVAAGDVVVAPIPFATAGYPREWLSVLDSLAALDPAVVVPGHGPVLEGSVYLRRVRELLATTQEAAQAAVTRGDSLRALLQSDALTAERRVFAGEDRWAAYLFETLFRRPGLASAFTQARTP